MTKPSAFLLNTADFLVDISDLTMRERGAYITLLCLQHQRGRLSEKAIKLSLDIKVLTEISDVMAKFIVDENGLFYNEKLEYEVSQQSTDCANE